MKTFEYESSIFKASFIPIIIGLTFLIFIPIGLSIFFISFIPWVFLDYSTQVVLEALEELFFFINIIGDVDIITYVLVGTAVIVIPIFLISFYPRHYRIRRSYIYAIDYENNNLYSFQHALASNVPMHFIGWHSSINKLPLGKIVTLVHNINNLKITINTLKEIAEDNPMNLPIVATWYFEDFKIKKKNKKGLWLIANVINLNKDNDKKKRKKFFISSKYNDYEELCSFIESKAVNSL